MQQKATAGRLIDWPIVLFFVLAYTLAWGAFAVLGLIARQSGIDSAQTLMVMGESFQFEGASLIVPQWLVYLLTRLADFAFSIAGVIMIGVTAGRGGLQTLWQRLTRWKIGWEWYVLGLVPLVLYAAAAVAAGAIPSANFSSETLTTAFFSLGSGFFVSLFLRGAFGEEFGLRGFAQPHLQARMSPFRTSLIIGVLWGAWHLPVLIGRDVVSVVAFSLLSIGLAMIFTWMYNGSSGSLIPGLLFHATQNWEEGFETFYPALVGTDWELISTLSLLVLGIVAGVVVWRSSSKGA